MNMPQIRNYYEILGISPTTEQALIKAAAQRKANEINEAFRVLNDPQQRHLYDAKVLNLNLPANANTIENGGAVNSTLDKTTGSTSATTKTPQETNTAPVNNRSYRSSVRFSTQKEVQAGSQLTLWWQNMKSRMSIEAPTSIRDVVIFIAALAFVGYMASGFFTSPTERFAKERVELKRLSAQQPK